MKLLKKISLLALILSFSSAVFAAPNTARIELGGGIAKTDAKPLVISTDPLRIQGAPYTVTCTLSSDQKSGQNKNYVFVRINGTHKEHFFIIDSSSFRHGFNTYVVTMTAPKFTVGIAPIIKGDDSSIEISNLDDTDTITASCYAEPTGN